MKYTQARNHARPANERDRESPVTVPWLAVPDADGKPRLVTALVRAIDLAAEGRARKFAETWAEEHGHEGARRGDEFYDEGFAMACVAEAYVDADSPKDGRAKFIDDPRELESLHALQLDYLYDHFDTQQTLVSPFTHELRGEVLLEKARELAFATSDAPYTTMSPAMRWLVTRALACLVAAPAEARERYLVALDGNSEPQ